MNELDFDRALIRERNEELACGRRMAGSPPIIYQDVEGHQEGF
jgi:hypothetical protein